MNKKGQALIEFILILPFLLLIIMALIDIGNIFLKQYEINQDVQTVANLYENGENKKMALYIAKENLLYEEDINGNMTTITVNKDIEITTPILSNVLGKQYKIKASKTVYNLGDTND